MHLKACWAALRLTLVGLVLSGAVRAQPPKDPRVGLVCEPNDEISLLQSGEEVKGSDGNAAWLEHPARYTVTESGEVLIGDGDALTVCFDHDLWICPRKDAWHESQGKLTKPEGAKGARPTRVVRIERLAARGKEVIACGVALVGAVYEVPSKRPQQGKTEYKEERLRTGDALLLRSFDRVAEQPEDYQKLLTARQAELDAQVGHAEAARQLELPVKDLVKALDVPAPVAAGAATADQAIDAAISAVTDAQGRWLCLPTSSSGYPGSNVVCERLKTAQDSLTVLKTGGDKPAAKAKLIELSTPVLKAKEDIEAHCERVAHDAWLWDKDAARLISRHVVPVGPAKDVFRVGYDMGASQFMSRGGLRPILIVDRVPDGPTLTFKAKWGERKIQDPAGTIAGVFERALPLLLAVKPAKAKFDGKPYCQADEKIDGTIRSLMPIGSRVFTPGENVVDSELILTVCAGAKCEIEGDNKNVTNTVTLEPEASSALVALMGFGTTFRSGFPTLESVGGTTGPDQVFEVRDGSMDVLPTLDLLIGVRCQDFLLAAGPALFARDVGAFNHWKLAVGGRFRSFSRFVYMLGHVALTSEDKLVGLSTGERVFVAVPAMGEAEPNVRTSKELQWGLGITLGLDIAAIGSSADKMLNAVKGGDE